MENLEFYTDDEYVDAIDFSTFIDVLTESHWYYSGFGTYETEGGEIRGYRYRLYKNAGACSFESLKENLLSKSIDKSKVQFTESNLRYAPEIKCFTISIMCTPAA